MRRKNRALVVNHPGTINDNDVANELGLAGTRFYNMAQAPISGDETTLMQDIEGGGGGGGGTTGVQEAVTTKGTTTTVQPPYTSAEIDSWSCPYLKARIQELNDVMISGRFDAATYAVYRDTLDYMISRDVRYCTLEEPTPPPITAEPITPEPITAEPIAPEPILPEPVSVAPTPEVTEPTAVIQPVPPITAPNSSIILDGLSSINDLPTSLNYFWQQISGPGSSIIQQPNSAVTVVNNLLPGQYVFRLTVTNGNDISNSQTISILVNQRDNTAPVVQVGNNKSITLPTSTVILDGSASHDAEGDLLSFFWSKISGPSNVTINNANNPVASVSGLVEGSYVFRLTVVDSFNAEATADVQVVVLPEVAGAPAEDKEQGTVSGGQPVTTSVPVVPVYIPTIVPYQPSATAGGGGGGGGGGNKTNGSKVSTGKGLFWLAVAAIVISFLFYEKDTPDIGSGSNNP